MSLKNLLVFLLAFVLLAAAAAGEAYAQEEKKPKVKDKMVEKHRHQQDDDDDADEDAEAQEKLAKEAKISADEARRIALERIGGEVVESELERENGRVVYEFEIKTAEGRYYEVVVDAGTGEIVGVEDESEDEEDDDDPTAS